MPPWTFTITDFRTCRHVSYEYSQLKSLAAGKNIENIYEIADDLFLIQTMNKDAVDSFLYVEALTIYSFVERGSAYHAATLIEKPFTWETIINVSEEIIIAWIKTRAGHILSVLADFIEKPFRVEKKKMSMLELQLHFLRSDGNIVFIYKKKRYYIPVKGMDMRPPVDIFREVGEVLEKLMSDVAAASMSN